MATEKVKATAKAQGKVNNAITKMVKKDNLEHHLVSMHTLTRHNNEAKALSVNLKKKKQDAPKGTEISPSISRHIAAFNNNKMSLNNSRATSTKTHSFVPPGSHQSGVDKAVRKDNRAKQKVVQATK